VVLQAAIVNRSKPEPIDIDGVSLGEGWPIESTAECPTFELYWKHYAAYLVTEECVGSSGAYQDERYTGKALRVYTRSHFLDHLARDTGGHFQPLQHYKLICLNHLIDVAAETPPEIRIIDQAQESFVDPGITTC
jgi:hypothetical protein